jgi:uncharacterized membrane protein
MPESSNQPNTKTNALPAIVPKWLPLSGLILCLVGIADSIYLTIAHYTTPAVLACPDTGLINCAKVTSSSYSEILGIPLAVLGLLYFIAMLGFQLPVAWHSQKQLLRRIRLALGASGLVMILWLIYVELFRLNAICLFCTLVHIVTFALFGLTAIGTALTSES